MYQWPSNFGALNIPKYTMQMVYEAWSNFATASVFDVHVSCGNFASAKLVNPMVFCEISPSDCLLKNGDKLHPGEVISFEYANILPFRLNITRVRC